MNSTSLEHIKLRLGLWMITNAWFVNSSGDLVLALMLSAM